MSSQDPIEDRSEVDISVDEQPSSLRSKPSILMLLAIIILGCVLFFRTTSPDTIQYLSAPGKADELRKEMLALSNGTPPNYTIHRLREGVERWLITDINNPSGSRVAQSGGRRSARTLGMNPIITTTTTTTTTRAMPTPPQYTANTSPPITPPAFNAESYDHIQDNDFHVARDTPLSTFSMDVDTASYTNIRRFLQQGQLPPKDAVRIEECINFFNYSYGDTNGTHPFSVTAEIGAAPWNPEHRLALIGLKGYEPPAEEMPPLNLVFLIDVSGSMNSAKKLPLVQQTLNFLVERLSSRDRIGIVVYSGAAGTVLEPTSGANKDTIRQAINRLKAGGSTNGGEGIQLAYQLALEHQNPNAVNRVILCTDGDFNVGRTDRSSLIEYVQAQAKLGVDLTTLGFGMGNYKDGMLEQLADKGNGNYGYIDQFAEAKRLFGEELFGTLVTIAKDVKVQVEFNHQKVQAYRLIGYVNRKLADRDFNDDTKDAGEIGAGHTVTALYEIVPAGIPFPSASIDPLRYSRTPTPTRGAVSTDELFHVKLRYKYPDETKSRLLTLPVVDPGWGYAQSSTDLRFAASVAAYGMLLRNSQYIPDTRWEHVHEWASRSLGSDPNGHRRKFLSLILAAQQLS